jgi:hypothetical protein
MRFCLGFQFLNEASWLRRHLPIILQARAFDGVVAVDGGSTDDSAHIVKMIAVERDIFCVIKRRPWEWDFAKQQNHVIEIAQWDGFDAYLKWDPDELLWPAHIDQAAALLEHYHALVVSRYNFEGDRDHYCPYLYPDKQLRFVRLNEGFAWSEPLHATTNAYQLWREPPTTSPGVPRSIVWLPHVNIYHYEGTKPIEERELKWENYRRVARGEAPLTALPEGHPVPSLPVRFTVEFCGDHPQ